MTGIDILEKIKATCTLKRSPVVVLTTTDDSREIQRCYDLGANVYITKPVNYEGFANAIRQLGLFFSVIQVPENALTVMADPSSASSTSTTTSRWCGSCSGRLGRRGFDGEHAASRRRGAGAYRAAA